MAFFRIAVLAACLVAGIAQAALRDSHFESIRQMYQAEENGVRYYERGDYDKAFEFLQYSATRGLKRSQYFMAFMFLKGQHVRQSVLLGMAWLGVASESGDPEWQALYDKLYAKASAPQREVIDRKVAQYIERYGLQAMNVTCERKPVTGSRRVETVCVKVEGPAYEIYPVELPPDS